MIRLMAFSHQNENHSLIIFILHFCISTFLILLQHLQIQSSYGEQREIIDYLVMIRILEAVFYY